MTRSKTVRIVSTACMALAFTACDILDVENPNNLVEEDILVPTAASAVVNGALAATMRGIETMSLPYMVTSDEVQWIGSRDAWGALDNGNVTDPNNEFTDAAFPSLAEARWMADRAVEVVQGHVDENPGDDSFALQLARAKFIAGMVYAMIPQFMEDFVFSNKTEAGSAVGPDQMGTLFDQAISYLQEAETEALGLGNTELANRALAWRAQTRHAKVVWQKIQGGTPADPLVNDAAAVADAEALLGRVEGSWIYEFTFSAATIGSSRGGQINDRGEQNFGGRYVTLDDADATKVVSIDYQDPITGETDPRVRGFIERFQEQNQFPSMPAAAAKEAHLILAEASLAAGDDDGFADHVNAVRSMYGLPDYTGQIPALDMLQHERIATLFGMNRRLADMYRFGVRSDNWSDGSDAVSQPGVLFPLTCIEVRANPNLENPRC
jgi:hypothetical protein